MNVPMSQNIEWPVIIASSVAEIGEVTSWRIKSKFLYAVPHSFWAKSPLWSAEEEKQLSSYCHRDISNSFSPPPPNDDSKVSS